MKLLQKYFETQCSKKIITCHPSRRWPPPPPTATVDRWTEEMKSPARPFSVIKHVQRPRKMIPSSLY